MKMMIKLLAALLIMGVLAGTTTVQAQGRGNGNGRSHEKHKHDHDRSWDRFDHQSNREWRGPKTDRHGKRYVYHRPPHWATTYGYRSQPRYVYYRDYNVYYDCYRGLYITFSGRNWVYTPYLPACMERARFDRVVYMELDYFDDDLPDYIERRRSGGYVSIYSRF